MSRKRRDRYDAGQAPAASAFPAAPSGVDRDARRALFALIRKSVVAVVSAPDQLAQPAGTPPPFASLTVVGTAFVVDGSGTALTTRRVIQPWLDAVQVHKGGGGPLPSPPKVTIATPVAAGAAGQHWGFVLGVVSAIQASSVDDIAAIQFRPPPEHELAPLDLSEAGCQDGDEVVVCGFPMGLTLSQDPAGGTALFPSFSQGIVSAAIPFPENPTGPDPGYQLNVNLSGGTSGAPVVDLVTGQVVGIVTEAVARLAANANPPRVAAGGLSGAPTGLARALNAHRALSVIADLRQTLAG